MPYILTIPPLKFQKMNDYGGRVTAVAFINANDKNKYKARVETLIFNDKLEIFAMLTNKPWKIELPGGTVEIDYTDHINNPPVMDILNSIAQAEIYEESKIVTKELVFGNQYRYYTYDKNGDNKWQKKLQEQGLDVIGDISFIYTATYLGPYTCTVDEVDNYPEMVKKGKFYPYLQIKKFLNKEHHTLIDDYISKHTPVLDTDDLKL
jgi:hypothetical protein